MLVLIEGIDINAVDILSRFVVYDDFQVDVTILLFNNDDVCILLLLYCELLFTAATDTDRQ